MRITPPIRIIILLLAMISFANANDKVLLHEGPSTIVPLASPNRAIRFDRRFFIDRQKLKALSSDVINQKLNPIDAIAAIKAAKSTVFKGDTRWPLDVNKLEKLKAALPENISLEYYLITIATSGSEEHRIVLLDGTVLEPEAQSVPVEVKNAHQDGAGQPATRSESDSEGSYNPQPKSEVRSR